MIMININYPKKLISYIKNSKTTYIPKKLDKGHKYLKQYKKHYTEEFNPDYYFKVLNNYKIEDNVYSEITFSYFMYWCIPNPVQVENIYELSFDIRNVMKEKDLVNSGKSYFGYEIKYWFYKNYKNKYKEFKEYLEDNSESCINDYNKYILTGTLKSEKYINCKIKIERKYE